MRVMIEGEKVDLRDDALIGQGGEGRVFRVGARAVKIFHAISAQKAAKLEAFPGGLPRGVVAPIHLARDSKGAVVGFAMELVRGGVDAHRLASRRFRHGAMRNAEVCALLRRLHLLVGQLHARGVTLGDLNDGNVLFTGTLPWLIDADSMQFGGHLCTVAHERFLDPRLFGVDLARGAAFDAGSDWYAFAVLTFASLLYVHPYGGQHATLPTMLRRAEARHSILRPDVAYPRAATPFAVLPDDLLHAFTRVFDDGARPIFPEASLTSAWTVCACGVEHARRSCPGCTARVQVPAAFTAAGVQVTRVFATRGRVVAAAAHGGLDIAYVDEDGVLRREDGLPVPVALGRDARVLLAGKDTWVHEGTALSRVTRGHVVRRMDAVAFGAGLAGAYVATSDWLEDAHTGDRVGQVIAATTWLAVGERFAVGFYRAGRVTVGFVIRPGGGMLRAHLPAIDGRLVDAHATFDGDRALLSVAFEKDGRRTHSLTLLGADGAVVAAATGGPESSPLLAGLLGKCMAHGAILSITEAGLLLSRPDPKTRELVPIKTFAATAQFVAAATDILAGPEGSVYAVHTGEILRIGI